MMINIRKTDEAVFLEVMEDLITPHHVAELKRVLQAVQEEGPSNVIINFNEVKIVIQGAWSAIAAAARELRPSARDIKLAGLDPLLEKDIKLSKFNTVLETYKTEADALSSFSGSVSQVERNVLFKFK